MRRPRLAGLGASPSVAARQLPLGGSDWIGLFGGRLQAGRLRLADRRAAFGGGCLEGELPKAEGEAVRRPRLARLGASPTVAARQLPLGGSDWIGLFGGRLQAGRLWLLDRRAPFGGGCPRVGAAEGGGGGRAAAQAGGAGSLPLSRCATAPPRGERLDRVVRGATPGWQALAPRSARSVRRWLPRSVAAALCPLPAQGQAAASSPAEWGERRSGRPIPGFGRPLLVADREERGSGLFRGFLDERFAVGGRALDLCGGDHSCPAARPAMRPKTEPAMRPEPPA